MHMLIESVQSLFCKREQKSLQRYAPPAHNCAPSEDPCVAWWCIIWWSPLRSSRPCPGTQDSPRGSRMRWQISCLSSLSICRQCCPAQNVQQRWARVRVGEWIWRWRLRSRLPLGRALDVPPPPEAKIWKYRPLHILLSSKKWFFFRQQWSNG